MDNIVKLSSKERQELFTETAARKNMTAAIIEKDFWVTWTLYKMFSNETLSKLLVFKGGTSLSKVYGLIERFSEDIDLILDWRVVTDENPNATRGKKKQERLNKDINNEAKEYIATALLALIKNSVGDVCSCAVDEKDGFVINVNYPAAYNDAYLRPEVRLEIGPLASWLPSKENAIQSYVADEFGNLFDVKSCQIPTILAQRTFWEKATILHHEANRPEGSIQPARYSRHYYDLVMMATSNVKNIALADLELLKEVVEFKKKFYARSWADYDSAANGHLKLIPKEEVYMVVKDDYKAMRNMIFGKYPEFDEIMEILRKLEIEINKLTSMSIHQ